MKRMHVEKRKVITAFIILIFFFMLLGLNARLSEFFRLSNQRDIMQTKVISLSGTEKALQTQIAFATSDLSVEAWARDEGHLAQPGDNVIIPLAPYSMKPQPKYLPTPTISTQQNWQVWWDLFFGK
jgi:cell division protein FtsB